MKRFSRLKLAMNSLAVIETEAGLNVLPHLRGCRRRQGNTDGAGQARSHLSQLAIFRTKIRSPFRDAVRFVDGKAGHGKGFEQGPYIRLEKRLRRDVQQLGLTSAQPFDIAAIVSGDKALFNTPPGPPIQQAAPPGPS